MPLNPNTFEYEFSPGALVEIRERLGLSQAKLAGQLDLPSNTISRWERGETAPSANYLAAIYSISKREGLDPTFFKRRPNMKQSPRERVITDCLEIIKRTKGKPVKSVDLGNQFKKVFGEHGVTPEQLKISKNHPTRSLLNLLEEQQKIQFSQTPGDAASVIIGIVGDSAQIGNNRTRYFTIQRKGSASFELTVVGKDGQKHTMARIDRGKDGHFTDEGQYWRAIDQAVRENSR